MVKTISESQFGLGAKNIWAPSPREKNWMKLIHQFFFFNLGVEEKKFLGKLRKNTWFFHFLEFVESLCRIRARGNYPLCQPPGLDNLQWILWKSKVFRSTEKLYRKMPFLKLYRVTQKWCNKTIQKFDF